MKNTNKFKKDERLTSHNLIIKLVKKGKPLKVFPFYVKWLYVEDNISPIQLAVSVSKKKYKKAVDRNKIKRKVKEAYRLLKKPLIEKLIDDNKNIILIISYIHKDIIEYNEIEKSIKKIIHDLILKTTTYEKK